MGQLTSRETGTDRRQMNSGANPPVRPLRFLVVDDDALSRNMMDLMLSPHGYEIEFACDGAEALEAMQSRPYDLVFMDLVLPDMSGIDVTRQVRQWEAGKKHLPIVAVTAYDMPGQPLELVRAGMDDYIFKPYDLRGLTRIIELYAKGEDEDSTDPANPRAAAAIGEAPILDTEGSLLDFANDVDSYKTLLKDFVGSLPARLDKIVQAHEAGDCERLNRECHTLKGVSAGLGALRLSRLATHLGRTCADGRQASAGPLVQEMGAAMADVRAAAMEFIGSGPGPD